MAEIRSPYFSFGGSYYLGDNAEIQSPYVSYGTRCYHGDNAEIHSSHFSVGDYDGEDAEIPSEAFFHQDDNVENPYNAEQDVVQNIYHTENLIPTKTGEEWGIDVEAYSGTPEEKEEKCIYKVSEALRKSKGNIYSPREISIGPIHHYDKDLQSMGKQKVKYFKEFCNRVAKERNEQQKFEGQLRNIIEQNEDRIRRCYGDDGYQLAQKVFLRVVLIDAVFILEYLLRYAYITTHEDKESREKKYGNDYLLRRRFGIRWDLMLLENQLPFFILQELYDLLPEDIKGEYPRFRDLACYYFDKHIQSQHKPETDDILHFTDLVRSLLSFCCPRLETQKPIGKYYRATQLHEAGIKIKKSPNAACLLGIEFGRKRGELNIPRLELNDYTECIFGNLLAFEKYHYQGEEYICHYLKFFDTLIDKPKDADLLIKNKIIATSKDGAKVKAIIEKLSAETFEHSSCYYTVYERIDDYYQDSLRKNILLYFRKTYFGDVWKTTATVIATILVFFSAVQAVCSVISVIQNS